MLRASLVAAAVAGAAALQQGDKISVLGESAVVLAPRSPGGRAPRW